MRRSPPPEVEALLLATRWSDRPEDRRRLVRLATSGLDWDRLLDLAADHRVSGLLRRRLEGVEIPESAKDRLRSEYAETWARTVGALAALPPVLEALGKAGVSVVLLKGIDLVQRLYGDAGLRPLTDVDLLVRPEEAGRAREVLVGLGFEPWEEDEDHLERGPLLIELHSTAVDLGRIEGRRFAAHLETDSIWQRARPSWGDPPYVLRPSPEDHLLYLCRHLLQHSYEGLIWFTDVAGFIQENRGTLDWETLFRRARETSLRSILTFVLRFLGEALEEDLPPPAAEALSAAPASRRERWLLDRLSRRLEIGPVANLLLLPTIRGFRGRAAFLWESCFPQDHVMRQIYPSYRPGRRAWFCALRALQLASLGVSTAVRLLLPVRGPVRGQR